MKADYDSEADALIIELVDGATDGYVEDVYDSICTVTVADGKPVGVELLGPREEFKHLSDAAERYDLDRERLEATARAALAAPDRIVTVSERQPDSSGRVPSSSRQS